MAVKFNKLGPGTLSFGDIGSPVDAACQATGVVLAVDVDQDDDVTTLCGDSVPGATKYTYKLSGTFVQDLGDPAGIVAFSHANKGTVVPFTFTPSTEAGATVTGDLTPNPLDIGGDTAGDNMTSDFEWKCVGEPTVAFGPGDEGDDVYLASESQLIEA
jgi:hypothetical protein